jgi:hypothetical protein
MKGRIRRPVVDPKGLKPTARDIKTIGSLIARAGGERELRRWIRQSVRRRAPGRPVDTSPYNDDNFALLTARILHLGKKGFSLHRAIKLVASWGFYRWRPHRGTSEKAMVKRLLAKNLAERKAFEQPSGAELSVGIRELFSDWTKDVRAPTEAEREVVRNFTRANGNGKEADPQTLAAAHVKHRWLVARILTPHLAREKPPLEALIVAWHVLAMEHAIDMEAARSDNPDQN